MEIEGADREDRQFDASLASEEAARAAESGEGENEA
jgi:hypothetical protein